MISFFFSLKNFFPGPFPGLGALEYTSCRQSRPCSHVPGQIVPLAVLFFLSRSWKNWVPAPVIRFFLSSPIASFYPWPGSYLNMKVRPGAKLKSMGTTRQGHTHFLQGKLFLPEFAKRLNPYQKHLTFQPIAFHGIRKGKKKKKHLKCEKKKEKEKTLAKKLYSFHKQKLSFGFHSLTFIFQPLLSQD